MPTKGKVQSTISAPYNPNSDIITKNMEALSIKQNVGRQTSNSSSSGKSSGQGLATISAGQELACGRAQNVSVRATPTGKTSPASYDSGMPSSAGVKSTLEESAEGFLILSEPCFAGADAQNEVGRDPTGRIQEFLKGSSSSTHADMQMLSQLTQNTGSRRLSFPRARRHSGNQHYYSLSYDTVPENISAHLAFQGPPNSLENKVRSERKNDRKSRSGVSLAVCKNGGGGKFTWGKPGIEYTSSCPSGAKDENDPNFEEFEEDENTVYEIRGETVYTDEDIRTMLFGPFREYLFNADDSELMIIFKQLDDCRNSANRTYFHLLLWSLEASRKFRGHIWILIKKLLSFENYIDVEEDPHYSSFYSEERAIFKALEDFFDARVELIIDHPDYDEFIQKILGCLIYERGNSEKTGPIDEFLAEQMRLRAKTFSKVVSVSYSIVSRIKSSSAIMSEIWIMDDYLTPEQLSFELSKIVDDWKHDGFSARSLAQDLRSGVNAPHYYHELVYQLLIKALSIGSTEALEAVVQSLAYLVKSDILELNQVKTGFMRIFSDFDELKIDIPKATLLIAKIVNDATKARVIDDEVRVKMPRMRGDRRRAFSEMV